MPLIKKVAWPWRDVTPFELPRELASCAPFVCVRAGVCVGAVECIHCGLGCLFFVMKKGMAEREQKIL